MQIAHWISGSATPKPTSHRTIYADGTAGPEFRPGVDLELSHWIPNRTPREFKADTSTGICLGFVAEPTGPPYDLVVNNHADADGVLSVFVCVEPALALAHRAVLVQAAEIGDFWGWGPPPAQALYQGLALSLARTADRDPGERYRDALARIPELLERGADDREVAPGLAAFARAEAVLTSGAVRRDLVAPRLARYLIPRALADRDRAAALRCPGFSAPFTGDILLPPHVRAREDRERLQLVSVETAGGWFHDVCYPGYLWADTVHSWRLPDPIESGPAGGADALAAVLARLQAAERGPGRWTAATGDSLLDAEVPGRGWPVAAAFIHAGAPAVSTIPPAAVADAVAALAGPAA